MATMTVSSEDARNKFRDMLDVAVAGGETIIERYGKPTAVVVNYEMWQQWRQLWLAMLDQRSAEMRAGNYVSFEDVEAELRTAA